MCNFISPVEGAGWETIVRQGICCCKVAGALQHFTTTLLAVFEQVGLTTHGLKSRLVFARAVCWPRIHVPQAWIGCWTGFESCSTGVAFGQSSFTDLDFADDISLLV